MSKYEEFCIFLSLFIRMSFLCKNLQEFFLTVDYISIGKPFRQTYTTDFNIKKPSLMLKVHCVCMVFKVKCALLLQLQQFYNIFERISKIKCIRSLDMLG